MSRITRSITIGLSLLLTWSYSQAELNGKVSTATPLAPVNHFFDAGVGAGLDYGGLAGLKLAYILPFPYVSVFASGGYDLVNAGWNTGVTIHFLPETSQYFFRPNVKVMYGVNGRTGVTDTNQYDKLYLGPTVGLGFEFRFGPQKSDGFDLDVNLPLHGKDYRDQLAAIKSDPQVVQYDAPLPFAISIGYHHEFPLWSNDGSGQPSHSRGGSKPL